MEKRKQGRPATGNKYVPLSIALEQDQIDTLRKIAVGAERTMAFIVRNIIRKSLAVK